MAGFSSGKKMTRGLGAPMPEAPSGLPESTGQGGKSQGIESFTTGAFCLLARRRRQGQCPGNALPALITARHTLVRTYPRVGAWELIDGFWQEVVLPGQVQGMSDALSSPDTFGGVRDALFHHWIFLWRIFGHHRSIAALCGQRTKSVKRTRHPCAQQLAMQFARS